MSSSSSVVWASSFIHCSPPRYRGRYWAAIRLSHRPEPSGRVVRGGRWIGQWRTTLSTVCSAPHSQAAEEALPNLYRQERKRPTPVRRRLSRTQACNEWKHESRKKRKRVSTIIHGRPQKFFRGGKVNILFIIFKLLMISVPSKIILHWANICFQWAWLF